LARGDNIRAFDLAGAALAHDPGDLRAAHTMVLALARTGATERAEEEYDRLGLGRPEAPPDLRADLLALRARLAKDRAVATAGPQRRRWAAIAAERYVSAAALGQGGYCEVNGATMAVLAGDDRLAEELAGEALAASESSPSDGLEAYWREVTRAEALLVLRRPGDAVRALDRAATLSGDDLSARATTRRQLLVLAEAGRAGRELLDHLPVPGVVAYGGHRFVSGDERALAAAMEDAVRELDIGFAFGSLASGADTLWAEALLDHGAELHVVLPFEQDQFVATSVRPAGDHWVPRHAAALEAAASVTVTSPGPPGDDALYTFASQYSQGQAIVRARALTATPTYLAAWDGAPAAGAAGTSADVERWKLTGNQVLAIDADNGAPPTAPGTTARSAPREVLAVLFGDFEGFSSLDDEQVARFASEQLVAVGEVLDAAGEDVVFRNSWGDGIYVACTRASVAARLGLALQDAVADRAFASQLRLRLGGHAGPALRLYDPVQGRDSWWGQTVVTAARIEPMTPAGEIYVTEPFAALIALEPASGFTAQYVGPVDTAKGYGSLPMYVLKQQVHPTL